MKRIRREAERFDALRLIDALGKRANVSLSDGKGDAAIVQGFASALEVIRKTPLLTQGARTEKMFGYVAASLGRCTAIKEEDVGGLYSSEPNLVAPDYRLVLKDGRTFFAEVKNCHKATGAFAIKDSYLDSLRRYCALFKTDLRLAIFWSGWNLWTLIDPARMAKIGQKRSIRLGQAQMINEMSVLGDFIPATRPPLVVRFLPKTGIPERLLPGKRATFTFNGVEVYCGHQRIVNPFERNLAFYFIMFGTWPAKDPEAEITDGKLISAFSVVEPEHETPGQGFELLGALSSMISRRYRVLTSRNAQIVRLEPSLEPGALGITIPDGYKGQQLPLWRFMIKPNPQPQKWEAKRALPSPDDPGTAVMFSVPADGRN